MDNLPGNDELEKFLKKVDQIESIVKGISSEDDKIVQQSFAKADKLILNGKKEEDDEEIEVEGIRTKTGVSRSVINKYGDGEVNPPAAQDASQAAFLSVLEQDANERYMRRKEDTRVANELKDKGNAEFKNGNFEEAVRFYSEGISKVKNIAVLYTNRAQAYIKLGKYKEAISDCDWALRVDEKFVKAFIHKSRALTHLKEFDLALAEFESAKAIDPKQAALIDDYIKELERCRVVDNQERAAQLFLTSCNETNETTEFLNILNTKLYAKDQDIWYYAGGMRCLAALCNDEQKRTLFRTQNGFGLFENHHVISNYFDNARRLKDVKANEIDLVCSAFELAQVVCSNCDENVRSVFKIGKFVNAVESHLFEMKSISRNSMTDLMKSVEFQLFKFLAMLAENEFGRLQIVNNLNFKKLLECLFDVNFSQADKLTEEKVLIIVENLALDSKFHSKLNIENVNFICTCLCKRLKNRSVKSKSVIITSIYALTSEARFREAIIKIDLVWTEALSVLESISNRDKPDELDEILANVVLSLFTNLNSTKSENCDKHAVQLVKASLKPMNSQRNQNQAVSLLGNITQKVSDPKKIIQYYEESFVKVLIENVKKENNQSNSLRLLAICSQHDLTFCEKILSIDSTLNFLYNLFKDVSQIEPTSVEGQKNKTNGIVNLKKLNETVINNSVLCMTNCAESSDGKLSAALASTNIIMDLLYLTRDGYNAAMQKNCGILISKLVKKDERHLERLRELHGVEILYAALKNKM